MNYEPPKSQLAQGYLQNRWKWELILLFGLIMFSLGLVVGLNMPTQSAEDQRLRDKLWQEIDKEK